MLKTQPASKNTTCWAFSSSLTAFLLLNTFLKKPISWVSRSLLWVLFFYPWRLIVICWEESTPSIGTEQLPCLFPPVREDTHRKKIHEQRLKSN